MKLGQSPPQVRPGAIDYAMLARKRTNALMQVTLGPVLSYPADVHSVKGLSRGVGERFFSAADES